jgi:hypothetical protein
MRRVPLRAMQCIVTTRGVHPSHDTSQAEPFTGACLLHSCDTLLGQGQALMCVTFLGDAELLCVLSFTFWLVVGSIPFASRGGRMKQHSPSADHAARQPWCIDGAVAPPERDVKLPIRAEPTLNV